MRVRFDATDVTPHQADLAGRLEREIGRRAHYSRAVEPDDGNGPCVKFRVRTTKEDLRVMLALYQDSFHIWANEAEVRVGMPDTESYEDWVETAVLICRELFEGPLRFRIKTPRLFRWLPAEGAIYLSCGGQGAWSGSTAFGGGQETTVENWYEPAENPR